MRKYVIIEASEVATIDFNEVIEISANCLIYSVDGSQSLVKFDGATPGFLEGKTQYDHSEMLTILAEPDWRDPNP